MTHANLQTHHKISASVTIEVPFHDVDVMNVVWHGHYVKYLEIARCALLRQFHYDYPDMKQSGYLWPVVDCQIKYIKPACFGDLLEVTASLLEFENRLKIGYVITQKSTGTKMTKAHTTQVAIDAQTMTLQFVSPDALLKKIADYLQTLST